jgi:hypothetical protein
LRCGVLSPSSHVGNNLLVRFLCSGVQWKLLGFVILGLYNLKENCFFFLLGWRCIEPKC